MTDVGAGASRRAVLQAGSVAAVAGVAGFVAFDVRDKRPVSSSPYGSADTGTVLARADDVPAGGGVVLSAKKVVLTRGADGQVHAFSAVCTHQGCLVSSVRDGAIVCPCHGSRFDASTGNVLSGPATTPLPSVTVVETGDTISTG